MRSLVLIMVVSFFLFGCATTQVPVKTVCPKIELSPIPKEEKPVAVKNLPPGKAFTPAVNSVAMTKSNWSLMELYNKSLRLWAESTVANIDKYNQGNDQVVQEIRTEKPWYRRIW